VTAKEPIIFEAPFVLRAYVYIAAGAVGCAYIGAGVIWWLCLGAGAVEYVYKGMFIGVCLYSCRGHQVDLYRCTIVYCTCWVTHYLDTLR